MDGIIWEHILLPPSTAKVELSNESVGTMVFADAIKWIEND